MASGAERSEAGLGTTKEVLFIIDFLDFNLEFLGFPILLLGFPRISQDSILGFYQDFDLIWLDLGWIRFDFGWIWLDLLWILVHHSSLSLPRTS